MAEKRIGRLQGGSVPSRAGGIAPAILAGLPPVLRPFARFMHEMAKRFSKNLVKGREEEFLKVVKKHFEKGR